MDKNKILENIEDGLLNYYLDKDYSIDSKESETFEEVYSGQSSKYEKIVKQILFKANTNVQKIRVAKIISIAKASNRLKLLEEKNKENVFSIFKKHVEQHGLAANYRNFDKMTNEEMGNILEQLDLTALFDEIDSNLENE